MSSIIDLGIIEGLQPLFIFLIVFAVVFGILSGTKLLGTSKSIHAIIALVLGLITIISANLIKVISIMIPWFIILAIFLILVLIAMKTAGVPDDQIVEAAQNASVYWTIIIIALVIIVGSLASVYGQQELGVTKSNTTQLTFGEGGEPITATDDFDHNVRATFYHPKVLGFILFILIGLLTITQLTRE